MLVALIIGVGFFIFGLFWPGYNYVKWIKNGTINRYELVLYGTAMLIGYTAYAYVIIVAVLAIRF